MEDDFVYGTKPLIPYRDKGGQVSRSHTWGMQAKQKKEEEGNPLRPKHLLKKAGVQLQYSNKIFRHRMTSQMAIIQESIRLSSQIG